MVACRFTSRPLPCICPTTLQAGTVGIAEPQYRPGVKLGEIKEATIAGRAGLRQGDVLLQIGDLEVAPEAGSVGKVVDKIK